MDGNSLLLISLMFSGTWGLLLYILKRVMKLNYEVSSLNTRIDLICAKIELKSRKR